MTETTSPEETPEKVPEETPVPSRGKRALLWVALGFGCLFLIFLIGEIAVRILSPTPRVQVIRASDSLEMEVVNGIPVWRGEGSEERENLRCLNTKPAHRIAVIGSSIFFGSGLDAKESFSALLQNKLDQKYPSARTCVLNYAQPGFSFDAKWIRTRQAIENIKPDLIVFELWYNDINPLVLLNDEAINIGQLSTNEWNHPDLLGLPLSMNAWLLEHSRFFQYASLALATKGDEANQGAVKQWRYFALHEISKVVDLGKGRNIPILFVFAPNLNGSLSAQADNTSPAYTVLADYLKDMKANVVFLSRLLRDDDYMAIRLDDCCHYNAEGMKRITDVLLPFVDDILFPPPNKEEIWKRLSAYEDTYLKKWRPVFQLNGEIKPVDVIDAFNALAYQMTGPDGLWRKAVPIVWLRCDNKPESPNCLKLQEYNDTFKELDAFQEKIARTKPMHAGSFLLANMDKINEYLDRYVLATPTRAGMKATRFYREKLTAPAQP